MQQIISLQELLSQQVHRDESQSLIDRVNQRLMHARTNGASCIVLGRADGFVLFHADRSPKKLPAPLIACLGKLAEAGYMFLKDSAPSGDHSLRVYFQTPPANHRVTLDDLKCWPSEGNELAFLTSTL